MKNLRKIVRIVESKEEVIAMRDLVAGDIFKMFEGDQQQEQIGELWEASGNAYLVDNVWGVIANPIKIGEVNV